MASIAFLLFFPAIAAADYRSFLRLPESEELARSLQSIASGVLAQFGSAAPTAENLSMTVVDLDRASGPVRASFNGDQTYHPASVVKLFFLIGAWERLREGKLVMGSELQRALTDMIVESSNDATSYVVDAVTDTASGPELTGEAWRQFRDRRNWLNRYFASGGYDVNVNGKAFCEGPYGRDKELLGPNREFRNRITSRAVAALMYQIEEGSAVSPGASQWMLNLMRRDVDSARTSGENQVIGFGGEGLPPGSQLWSKAGWTSEVRHDAMLVRLPSGHRYIAVILTRGAAANEAAVPEMSRRIAAAIGG